MNDIWEGTVVCHRKALSHISHNHCMDMRREPENCGSCAMHSHIIALRALEKRRVDERRAECKKLVSRRAS